MPRESRTPLERTFAEIVDGITKDDWSGRTSLIMVVRDSGGPELDLLVKEVGGDPYDGFLELPPDDRYLVACLSSMGHTVPFEGNAAQRMRVRSTVAVGRSGDYAILRYKNGRVDRLEGATGRLYEVMATIVRSPAMSGRWLNNDHRAPDGP